MGQGNTTTSPMHYAMIVSAIANGGTLMKPYMVDRIENYHGSVVEKNFPSKYATLMTLSEATVLTELMEEVVSSGTATKLSSKKYTAAGKTGTAQTGRENPTAWFVGFASSEQPDIVVSIVLEDAGSASDYAVPIAKKIFDAYYK